MTRADRRKRIIESYYPLVEKVVGNLLSSSKYITFKDHEEDMLSEGYLGLIAGIDTYDPSRGMTPVSYFSLRIRGYAKNYIRDYLSEWGTLCDIEDIGFEPTAEEVVYDESWVTLVDKYEPEDERDKMIYHQILMGDCTYKEVADQLDQTPQAVRRRTQRLKKILRDQILEGGEVC